MSEVAYGRGRMAAPPSYPKKDVAVDVREPDRDDRNGDHGEFVCFHDRLHLADFSMFNIPNV